MRCGSAFTIKNQCGLEKKALTFPRPRITSTSRGGSTKEVAPGALTVPSVASMVMSRNFEVAQKLQSSAFSNCSKTVKFKILLALFSKAIFASTVRMPGPKLLAALDVKSSGCTHSNRLLAFRVDLTTGIYP